MKRASLIVLSSLLGPAAWAGTLDRPPSRLPPGAHALCPAAIGAAERTMRLPPALLGAIADGERYDEQVRSGTGIGR